MSDDDDEMIWWRDGGVSQTEAKSALDLLNEYLEAPEGEVPGDDWEQRVFELIENRRPG